MPESFLAADGNDRMLLTSRSTTVARPNAPKGSHEATMPAMRGGQAEEAAIFAGFHGGGPVTLHLADDASGPEEAFIKAEEAPTNLLNQEAVVLQRASAGTYMVPMLVLLAIGGLFLAARKA